MAQQPESGRAEGLALKLDSLRQASAELPEEERRQTFRDALREDLGALPEEQATDLVREVRSRLIDDARQREQRLAVLEQQVEQLTTQLEAARDERDRLAEQTAGLQRGGGEVRTVATGGKEILDKIREGLRLMADDKEVTAESLGLPPSEVRLFRMIQALLGFALKYEEAVNLLLTEFSIGPTGGMDTQQFRGYIRLVKERFRACLDDKEGSLRELKDSLERNSRFLIDLNSAYTSCSYAGSREMLTTLDPQPALDKNKRMMGHNFEEAFNALGRVQGDLMNLTRSEMWGQFFYKAFRTKLSGYIESPQK